MTFISVSSLLIEIKLLFEVFFSILYVLVFLISLYLTCPIIFSVLFFEYTDFVFDFLRSNDFLFSIFGGTNNIKKSKIGLTPDLV